MSHRYKHNAKGELKRGATAREHWDKLASLVKADGCSSAPDLWFSHCCNCHDVHYRSGKDEHGFPITRAQADKEFLRCLRASAISPFGKFILAEVYYLAVRWFGQRSWRDEKTRINTDDITQPEKTG